MSIGELDELVVVAVAVESGVMGEAGTAGIRGFLISRSAWRRLEVDKKE